MPTTTVQPFSVRFFEFDLWLQVAFVALALLLLALAGLILFHLVAYTVALTIPAKQESVKRRLGLAEMGLGLVLAAVGTAVATLPNWLPQLMDGFAQGGLPGKPPEWIMRASHVSLPLLAASLYALSEGLGAVLFARRRVGVVMLIWAMVAGLVWLLAGF